MARELFGDVSNPSVRVGSQRWYSVPLSIAAHLVAFAAFLIVPLMALDVVPAPSGLIAWYAPPPLPDTPPPPAAARVESPQPARPASNPDAAPINSPDTIAPEEPRPALPAPPGVVGGLDLPGTGFGTGPGVTIAPPPPPRPATPPPPLRPGGLIRNPEKIHHVAPVYPVIAQQARVEGVVMIEATIGTDGRVKDARVLKSQPLLDQAAIDAVMQWRFTPTLLNGVPVPILMTVTVRFSLG